MARTPRNLLDTRPVELEQLVAQQQEVVADLTEWVADFVEASKEVAPPGRRKVHAPGLWPRLEERRMMNVTGISGERGTGKTTVMLSALKLWKEAASGKVPSPGAAGATPAAGRAREKAGAFARDVLMLDILDFDPLPEELPILSWVIQAFWPLADALGREDGAELTEAWQALFRTVTLGWDGGRLSRGDRALYEGVMERESQVKDWQSLQACWRRFLDLLFERLEGSELTGGREPQVIILPVDDLDLQVERIRQCLHTFRLLVHPRVLFLVTLHREHLVDVLVAEEVGRMYRLAGLEGADFPELDSLSREPGEWARELGRATADKVVRKDAVFRLTKLTLAEALAWPAPGTASPWLRSALVQPGQAGPYEDDRTWALGLDAGKEPRAGAEARLIEAALGTLEFLDRWPWRNQMRVASFRELVQRHGLAQQSAGRAEFHAEQGVGANQEAVLLRDILTWEGNEDTVDAMLSIEAIDKPRRIVAAEVGCSVVVGGGVWHRTEVRPTGQNEQNATRYRTSSPRERLARDVSWLYERRIDAHYVNGPFLLWTVWTRKYPGVVVGWPLPLFPECPFETEWVQVLWKKFEPRVTEDVGVVAYHWVRFWLAAMRRPDVEPAAVNPDATQWDALLSHVWRLARDAERAAAGGARGQGEERMVTFAYRRLPLIAAPEYGLPEVLRRKILDSSRSEVASGAEDHPSPAPDRERFWREVLSGDRRARLRAFSAWRADVVEETLSEREIEGEAWISWAGADTEHTVLSVRDGAWDGDTTGVAVFFPGSPIASTLSMILPGRSDGAAPIVPLDQAVFQDWFPKTFPKINAASERFGPPRFASHFAGAEGAPSTGGMRLGLALWERFCSLLELPALYHTWIKPPVRQKDRAKARTITLSARPYAVPEVARTRDTRWEVTSLGPTPGWSIRAAPTVPRIYQGALVEALGLVSTAMSDAAGPAEFPRLVLQPPDSIRLAGASDDLALPWPPVRTWLDHELLRLRLAVVLRAAEDLARESVDEAELNEWEAFEVLVSVDAAFRGRRGGAHLTIGFRALALGTRLAIPDYSPLVRHPQFENFAIWLRAAYPALDSYLGGHLADLLGEELDKKVRPA